MTMAFSSAARAAAPEHREALGGRDVRRGLTALLRRRVPLQEVEDVAQTVLADALASPSIPTDPEELRRWLTGIARHKIADYHRQKARAAARMADVSEPAEAVPVPPVAFEEREVLHALLGEKRSRREAETMEWLVREHAGERLADIASENGVPAPVVRQRVSRLRRALRSRWTGLFGVAAVLAGLSALGLSAYDPREAIAPDPDLAAMPTAPSSSPTDVLVKEAEGDWMVQSVRPSRPLTAAEEGLLTREKKGATVHVHGRRIELVTPGFKTAWSITTVDKTARGARLGLTNDSGLKQVVDVTMKRDDAGQRLEVTFHGAKFGGTVTLQRPAP